jgi:predicted NBD/HSP70 family sugar kinase/FMN phosphatase YigB (HAD superfamily)/glucose-6-phosphate isomerase/ssRNA-specific RNase YbeY (16S rRNA maturation enzyme)
MTEVSGKTQREMVDSMVLVHCGACQDVGPVLMDVARTYLTRRREGWKARLATERGFEEQRELLKRGDVKGIAEIEEGDWINRITIVPLGDNGYIERIIGELKKKFGKDYWGADSTGCRGGAGHLFFVNPERKREFIEAFLEISNRLRGEIRREFPIPVEPTVYDFNVNNEGITARFLRGKEAVIPGLEVKEREEGAIEEGLPGEIERALEFSKASNEAKIGSYKRGEASLDNNRRWVKSVKSATRKDLILRPRGDKKRIVKSVGSKAIKREEVAELSLAAGVGTRMTGGETAKPVYPILRIGDRYYSFIHLQGAKTLKVARRYGVNIPHICYTGFATDGPIRRQAERENNFGLGDNFIIAPSLHIGQRAYPTEGDFRYAKSLEPKLAKRQKQLRDQRLKTEIRWSKSKDEGGIFVPAGINKNIQFNPPGHFYWLWDIILNGSLGKVLEKQPNLKYLFVHNIDNLLATLDEETLGLHIQNEKAVSAEVSPITFENSGGGLYWFTLTELAKKTLGIKRDKILGLLEASACPTPADEFKAEFFNVASYWITVDKVFQEIGITRDEVIGISRGDRERLRGVQEKLLAFEKRLSNYVTLRQVIEDYGLGKRDKMTVAQFEKFCGDISWVIPFGYILSGDDRSVHIKEIAHRNLYMDRDLMQYLLPQLPREISRGNVTFGNIGEELHRIIGGLNDLIAALFKNKNDVSRRFTGDKNHSAMRKRIFEFLDRLEYGSLIQTQKEKLRDTGIKDREEFNKRKSDIKKSLSVIYLDTGKNLFWVKGEYGAAHYGRKKRNVYVSAGYATRASPDQIYEVVTHDVLHILGFTHQQALNVAKKYDISYRAQELMDELAKEDEKPVTKELRGALECVKELERELSYIEWEKDYPRMDTVYGRHFKFYTIVPIKIEEEDLIQKAAIRHLMDRGFKVGKFEDQNVKNESLIVVCDKQGGIRACLWEGKLLGNLSLRTLYRDLIKDHVRLDRILEQNLRMCRLSESEVLDLDKKRNKIHRQIVLIGILIGETPANSHYAIAAAKDNLREYGLPSVAVRFRDKEISELLLPIWRTSTNWDGSGHLDYGSSHKVKLSESLESELKEAFGDKVKYNIEKFTLNHREWEENHNLSVLTIPTDILPQVVELLKKFTPELAGKREEKNVTFGSIKEEFHRIGGGLNDLIVGLFRNKKDVSRKFTGDKSRSAIRERVNEFLNRLEYERLSKTQEEKLREGGIRNKEEFNKRKSDIKKSLSVIYLDTGKNLFWVKGKYGTSHYGKKTRNVYVSAGYATRASPDQIYEVVTHDVLHILGFTHQQALNVAKKNNISHKAQELMDELSEEDKEKDALTLKGYLDSIPPASESSIKLVIFDWGEVLEHYDYGIAAKKLAERFGIDRKVAYDFYEGRNTDRNNPLYQYEHGIIDGKKLQERTSNWLTQVSGRKIELSEADLEEIFARWVRIGDIPEALSLLQVLREKGYKVRILTTTSRLYHQFRLRHTKVVQLLENGEKDIYASYLTGLFKPDERSYLKVVTDTWLYPRQALFIDDRQDCVDGAKKAELRALGFNPQDISGSVKDLAFSLSSARLSPMALISTEDLERIIKAIKSKKVYAYATDRGLLGKGKKLLTEFANVENLVFIVMKAARAHYRNLSEPMSANQILEYIQNVQVWEGKHSIKEDESKYYEISHKMDSAPMQEVVRRVENQRIQDSAAFGVTIAVSLGGTKIGCAAVNPAGDIFARVPDVKTPVASDQVLLSAIWSQIEAVARKVGVEKVVKIGVSSPGPLNPETGVIIKTENIPFKNFPLGDRLEQTFADRFGRRVEAKVFHDADARANGEASVKGTLPGCKNMMFLNWGTGIGNGVIRNGKIYWYDPVVGFMIGEIGWTVTRTRDGKYRHYHAVKDRYATPGELEDGETYFELYLAGPALIQRMRQQISQTGTRGEALLRIVNKPTVEDLELRNINEAVRAGNELAIELIEQAGIELGRGLAAFIKYWKLERREEFTDNVVLGAGVAKIGNGVVKTDVTGKEKPVLLEAIKEGLRRELGKEVSDSINIVMSKMLMSEFDYDGELLAFTPKIEDTEQNVTTPRRGEQGRFGPKPGESPEDAKKVIALSPHIQGTLRAQGWFTLQDYRTGYKEVAGELGFDPLAENWEETVRIDLERLDLDFLTIDRTERPYKYRVTDQGKAEIAKIQKSYETRKPSEALIERYRLLVNKVSDRSVDANGVYNKAYLITLTVLAAYLAEQRGELTEKLIEQFRKCLIEDLEKAQKDEPEQISKALKTLYKINMHTNNPEKSIANGLCKMIELAAEKAGKEDYNRVKLTTSGPSKDSLLSKYLKLATNVLSDEYNKGQFSTRAVQLADFILEAYHWDEKSELVNEAQRAHSVQNLLIALKNIAKQKDAGREDIVEAQKILKEEICLKTGIEEEDSIINKPWKMLDLALNGQNPAQVLLHSKDFEKWGPVHRKVRRKVAIDIIKGEFSTDEMEYLVEEMERPTFKGKVEAANKPRLYLQLRRLKYILDRIGVRNKLPNKFPRKNKIGGLSTLKEALAMSKSAEKEPVSESTLEQQAKTQPHDDKGRFVTKPGKSPKDAKKLIVLSECLQEVLRKRGWFSLDEYGLAYRLEADMLGFDPLAKNWKPTATRDLEGLSKQGFLTIDESGNARLTSDGHREIIAIRDLVNLAESIARAKVSFDAAEGDSKHTYQLALERDLQPPFDNLLNGINNIGILQIALEILEGKRRGTQEPMSNYLKDGIERIRQRIQQLVAESPTSPRGKEPEKGHTLRSLIPVIVSVILSLASAGIAKEILAELGNTTPAGSINPILAVLGIGFLVGVFISYALKRSEQMDKMTGWSSTRWSILGVSSWLLAGSVGAILYCIGAKLFGLGLIAYFAGYVSNELAKNLQMKQEKQPLDIIVEEFSAGELERIIERIERPTVRGKVTKEKLPELYKLLVRLKFILDKKGVRNSLPEKFQRKNQIGGLLMLKEALKYKKILERGHNRGPSMRIWSILFGGLGISLVMNLNLFGAVGKEIMRSGQQAGWGTAFEFIFRLGPWGTLICAVTGVGAWALYRQVGLGKTGLVGVERVRLSEVLGLKNVRQAMVSLFERGWAVVSPSLNRASKSEQLRMSWANLLTKPLSEEEIKRIRALAQKLRRGEIARFWTKEGPFFANPEINPWLGWTYPTEERAGKVGEIEGFAESVRGGYENVVVIGKGVPYAKVAEAIGERRGYPEVLALESTRPEALREIESEINLEKTLFVVSSPALGEGYETYNYFYGKLTKFYEAQGISPEKITSEVGRHFVGIGEANRPFAKEAGEKEFLRVFTEESGVSRSIFSYEGLVPLALAGVNIERFLESGRKGREMCREENLEKNQGMQLALFQEAMRESGREIFMVLPEGLEGFGEAMQELVWSLGGEGEKIIPIAEGELSNLESYGENAAFIEVRVGVAERSSAIRQLREAGYPVFELPLRGKEAIGELFYAGEFATALSYLMSIDRLRRSVGGEGLLPAKAAGYELEVVSLAGAIGFEMRRSEPLSEYPVRPEVLRYKGTKVFVFDFDRVVFDIETVREATPSGMSIEFKVKPKMRAAFNVMGKIVKAAEEAGNPDGVKFAFVSSRKNLTAEVMGEMLRDYMSGYGLGTDVISRVIDSDLMIDRKKLEDSGGIVGITESAKISTRAVFNIINEKLLLSGRSDGNGSEIKIITDSESRWAKDGTRKMMERILWVLLEPAKEGEVLSTAAGLVVAIEGRVSEWLAEFIKARYPEDEAERLLSQIVRDGKIILPATPVDKKYLEGIESEARIYKAQA